MTLLKRFRIWLGLEELNWWDRDPEPLNLIQAADLLEALNRRSAA